MTEIRTNPLGWPTWLWRCLLALAFAMAAFAFAGSLSNLARAGGILHDLGYPGVTFADPQPAGTPTGWRRVEAIAPDSPAARAGLRLGDLVQLGRPWAQSELNRVAWTHPVTVMRDGRQFPATIATVPASAGPDTSIIALLGLGALLTTGLGATLLVRSRSNRAAAMLGAILIYQGLANLLAPPWAPNPGIAMLWMAIALPSDVFMGYFWPLFALEISGGASSRRQARLVQGACIGFAILSVMAHAQWLLPVHYPFVGSLWFSVLFLNQFTGYAIILSNYRRNDAPARNRLKIVLVAFFCYMVSAALRLSAGMAPPDVAVPLRFGFVALYYAGLALLVYAVLRRQLFDLNFALNRTLVYGAVSFILLAGFGLAEWGVEHLIPHEWHEGGPLFSAGIALALFLSFHRIRDWVEHHIEKLFFHSWQRNEAALRRFVASAGHVAGVTVLCRTFADELVRFTQGAQAALYLRGDTGLFELQAGSLAGAAISYAEDDRAFALMRTERRPLETAQAHSTLPGAMLLPLLDQGELSGFVLLGSKPDGATYRPDEVALLGWAAEQIGLDLRALRARELRAEVAALNERLAFLSRDNDRLSALLSLQSTVRA